MLLTKIQLPALPLANFAAALLVITSVSGCGSSGPELVAVKGTITLDGKPLEGAAVEFQPVAGSPSYGTTQVDGRYALRFTRNKLGALVGPHTVRISTAGTKEDGSGRERRVRETIPVEYNEESKLSADVQPGSAPFDFALRSGGRLARSKR